VSYSTVIHAWGRVQDLKNAELWMEKLRKSRLQANVVCYNSLILACSRAGDTKRAQHWLETMISEGVEPNVQCYNNVISSCSRDAPRAEEWLAKMEKVGLTPNASSYAAVVDAWSRCGNSQQAHDTFEKMQKKGISPNAEAYTYLARALARDGDISRIEAVADDMGRAGIPIDEYFLAVQLGAYANARPRQTEKAISAFKDGVAQGARVNKHVLSSLARVVGQEEADRLGRETQQGHRFRTSRGGPANPPCPPGLGAALPGPPPIGQSSQSSDQKASRPWRK
jgi:pentatricopeptide repeat protein